MRPSLQISDVGRSVRLSRAAFHDASSFVLSMTCMCKFVSLSGLLALRLLSPLSTNFGNFLAICRFLILRPLLFLFSCVHAFSCEACWPVVSTGALISNLPSAFYSVKFPIVDLLLEQYPEK
jgi:hypothetical protein